MQPARCEKKWGQGRAGALGVARADEAEGEVGAPVMAHLKQVDRVLRRLLGGSGSGRGGGHDAKERDARAESGGSERV